MQAAAARGAYVPGLSDYARANNVSPLQVTAGQAGSSYSNYAGRPGSAGMLSATANSKGVFTITSLKSPSVFTKAGKAMGAATAGAMTVAAGFEVGYAIGGGAAWLLGLPTGSGSSICDIATVVGSTFGCTVAAAPDYVVNQDVGLIQPGFAGGNDRFASATWTYSNPSRVGTIEVDVNVTGPPIGTPGPVTVTISPLRPGQTPEWYFSRSYDTCANVPFMGSATGCGLSGSASGIVAIQPEVRVSQYKGVGTYSIGVGSNGVLDKNYPVVWYPVGHELRPPEPDPDPLRYWRTKWTCTDGSSGSAQSQPFRESDEAWAVPVEPDRKSSCRERVSRLV